MTKEISYIINLLIFAIIKILNRNILMSYPIDSEQKISIIQKNERKADVVSEEVRYYFTCPKCSSICNMHPRNRLHL